MHRRATLFSTSKALKLPYNLYPVGVLEANQSKNKKHFTGISKNCLISFVLPV
jgi:hypothetical protein